MDQSFIDELINRELNPDDYLKPYAKKYKVPYKNGNVLPEEFVFCIINGQLNIEEFENRSKSIEDNFARHNKSVETYDAKEKLKNTIDFLKSFR